MSDEVEDILSRVVSGSSVIFAGSLINKIIAFGGSVFIARLLGDIGYGVLVIGFAVYSILANVLTLGLNSGIARNYPQASTDPERRGILVAAFRIGTVSALVGATVVFITARPVAVYLFDDESIAIVLQIFAVTLPLKLFLNLSNGVFRGAKHPSIKAALTSVFYPIVRIVGIVILVLAGYEAAGVAGAYLIAVGLTAVISLYYVYEYTSLFEFGSAFQPEYRSLLLFSLPLVGSRIVVDLMNNVDTLLLGALDTSAATGQYNVAFVLSETTLLFLQTLGFMYLPEISELYGQGETERAELIYRAVTKWVLFLSIPFILTAVAFPTYVLTFIYSGDFASATVPFLILAGGFLTHLINGPNHGTLTAFGDTRQLFLFDIFTLVINFALNLTLIPFLGIVGAAIATAVSYLVRNAAMTAYLYVKYEMVPFSRWLFTPLVPTVLVAGLLWWLVPGPSLLVVLLYALALVGTITLGFLSSGVEKADLILAELLEENLGVNLDFIRRVHERLQQR